MVIHKVVGLISGGKDSCFAMIKCKEHGHQVVALANLLPMDNEVDELDSYMYQTVGHQIVDLYATCMALPLFRRRICGSSRHQDLSYKKTQGDEVEDLFNLLSEVKRRMPSITAVSSGAIASDYQRLRVESVCSRLGLVSLAYLWKQDQSLLLREMIEKRVVAITVKVAAMGLEPEKHLGKTIESLHDQLGQLKERYGLNVCGEGGEYETLTLDCPIFTRARIVLDDFQVVMHSPGSIAPVAVLHPLTFHLEFKQGFLSRVAKNNIDPDTYLIATVSELEGEEGGDVPESEVNIYSHEMLPELVSITNVKFHVTKSLGKNTFSIGCWIDDPCGTSKGLQKDLTSILKNLEVRLAEDGFGWVNVLYVHLYISNMSEFALANETYVCFITEEKCHLGVPSRSTIELSLEQVGLGKAYVELLVAKDPKKRVLHVQSISCWAPNCIGPYSQATLYKEVLYMAGQLGLDPSSMMFIWTIKEREMDHYAIAELDQALDNCTAVAEGFNSSFRSSAILLVIYISFEVTSFQRKEIHSRFEYLLKQRKGDMDYDDKVDPVLLFVIATDLPRSALIEVKPVLYIPDDMYAENETSQVSHSITPDYWGLENLQLDDTCCQKRVVPGKICVGVLSIQYDFAAELFSNKLKSDKNAIFGAEKHIEVVARFCIYTLDKIILEHDFDWENITSLRFYFRTCLGIPSEIMSKIFMDALKELSRMSGRMIVDQEEPIFNLIPVLGSGRSAMFLDDMITCELFASKI